MYNCGSVQIEPFVPGNNFADYEARLHQYFLIHHVKENQKSSLLTIVLGNNVYETLKLLTAPHPPCTLPFNDLIAKLRQHFQPKTLSKRSARFQYFATRQENYESVDDFANRLMAVGKLCSFGDFIDSRSVSGDFRTKAFNAILIDQFIIGLKNENIRHLLLNSVSVDYKTCCSVAMKMELVGGPMMTLDVLNKIHMISSPTATIGNLKDSEVKDSLAAKNVHWNDAESKNQYLIDIFRLCYKKPNKLELILGILYDTRFERVITKLQASSQLI